MAKMAKLFLQIFYLAVYFIAVKTHRGRPPRNSPGSILIIKLDGIGDYILFRNYLERLRESEAFKTSRITLCGNSSWQTLAEHFDTSSIDDFIWIDRKRFVRQFRYTLEQLDRIHSLRFDIALQPTYSRDLADLILIAADAPRKVAFDGDTFNVNSVSRWISNLFVTDVVKSAQTVEFEWARNAEFFSNALGVPVSIMRPCFDDARVETVGIERLTTAYAVLFPGAGRESRQWPASQFAAVANHIRDKYGLAIVVAGGPNDGSLAREIQSGCSEVVDCTGTLTLAQMTKVIRDARVLVSNETMAVHMAVALRTRFVCTSNGNAFGRFLPYPDDVLSGSEYVFPEEMRAKGDAVEELVNRYSEWSDLDISAIAPLTVCDAVDRVLGAPGSWRHRGSV